MFPTQLKDIEARIEQIDPIAYASTRNFKEGVVTRLSPYISRGVVSTKQVFEHILSLGLPWYNIEKLVQELAWRDYWQQVWIAKGNTIDQDMKHTQEPIASRKIPLGIVNHRTQIEAIDKGIKKLYETGYMHNHMRMYVAFLSCNVAQSHWYQSAKWMYSNLLDGDWASNALSWQWVAGANANKKYIANQANINKYFDSNQRNTYLDIEYEKLPTLSIPEVLKDRMEFELNTPLPTQENITLDKKKKTLIYTYYNLDPYWHNSEDVQRILLLEPSFFDKYPVHQKCIDFTLELAKNLPNLQLFVGEFQELAKLINPEVITYKEHPTNQHFKGTEQQRDWMFGVKGYFPSFFAFWKKCKKEFKK